MAKLIRQKGSPFWYAECRDYQGNRYTKSTKQTDKAAAARAARQIELEGAVPGVRPYALSKALSDLYDYKVNCLCAKATLQMLSNQGARVLEWFSPQRDINTLNIQEIDKYVVHRRAQLVIRGHRARHMKADPEKIAQAHALHAEGKSFRDIAKATGLARMTIAAHLKSRPELSTRTIKDATIRKELGKLMEAILLAKRNNHFPGEPSALRTDLLKADKPKTRWLREKEFLDLLNAFSIGHDWLAVLVHTGARWGELCRIEDQHIDDDKMEITLIGTKGHQEYQVRKVPLTDLAYGILKARADLHPTGPLFHGWSRGKFTAALKRACKRIGIAPCSPNDLRRTFTMYHGIGNTDLREVKGLLGHSPASKTAELHYRQVLDAAGKEAMKNFPAPPTVTVNPPSNVVRLRGA